MKKFFLFVLTLALLLASFSAFALDPVRTSGLDPAKFDILPAVDAPGPATISAPYDDTSLSWEKSPDAYLRVASDSGRFYLAVVNDKSTASSATANKAKITYSGKALRIREGDTASHSLVATVRAYARNNMIAKTGVNTHLNLLIEIFQRQPDGRWVTPSLVRTITVDGRAPEGFRSLSATNTFFSNQEKGIFVDKGVAAFDLSNPFWSGDHTFQVSSLDAAIPPGLYAVRATVMAEVPDWGNGLTAVQVGVSQVNLEAPAR